MCRHFLGLLLLLPGLVRAQSGPTNLVPDGFVIRAVQSALPAPLRLAVDPGSQALIWLTYDGRLHRLLPPYRADLGVRPEVIATAEDHGLHGVIQGMTIGPDGSLYLVSNDVTGATTAGIVKRGRPDGAGGFTWSTVMQTEPYPRSNTPYDHSMSAIVVSPDGRFLYVNSGSRTDHGEVQSNAGAFPGVREVPLTSAILRIPTDVENLLLRNDEAFLKAGGYLFADGVRNAFDLAFDAEGRLFGTENAGDRDDNEELNWLREGHHYGFPWRIGTNDTPMRFPGYDPGQDRLLNPASTAVQMGGFYNDPAYPPPPSGVTFTDPVVNRGPDANRYRDSATGAIRKADGQPFGTFTSHRSPLGLVFDTAQRMIGRYRGGAFVLSWTGDESDLLRPFGDEGEDLLFLQLHPIGEGFETTATRVVKGFVNPIDMVQVGSALYVIEYGEGASLWKLESYTLPGIEGAHAAAEWRVRIWPEPLAREGGQVSFQVPVSQRVRVDVLTLLGQHVLTLFERDLAAGETPVIPLPAAQLAPGVHVLRISGAARVLAQPFVVR